ncbi:MAG: hypothetical protein WAN05_07480 [Roseiarcus sp.]
MARRPRRGSTSTLSTQAGLRPLRGVKGRPWEVIATGERISYNKGRARIAALSDRQRDKISKFERALGRSKNVERAQRESGLSQRGLVAYRKSFADTERQGASPWAKEKGRWRFEPERLSFTHTFLDVRDGGRWLHAPFVGRELIAMQNWRAAAFEGGGQAALDAWQKANPAGVQGADGQTYWPETDHQTIRASLKRMSRQKRKRIEEKVRSSGQAPKSGSDR